MWWSLLTNETKQDKTKQNRCLEVTPVMHISFAPWFNNSVFIVVVFPCSLPFINKIQPTNPYIYLFGYGAGGNHWLNQIFDFNNYNECSSTLKIDGT